MIFQTLKSKDKIESTGIGLSIVKKIVEMHEGKVWINSVPGEGTTFYFTIPKGIDAIEENAINSYALNFISTNQYSS